MQRDRKDSWQQLGTHYTEEKNRIVFRRETERPTVKIDIIGTLIAPRERYYNFFLRGLSMLYNKAE